MNINIETFWHLEKNNYSYYGNIKFTCICLSRVLHPFTTIRSENTYLHDFCCMFKCKCSISYIWKPDFIATRHYFDGGLQFCRSIMSCSSVTRLSSCSETSASKSQETFRQQKIEIQNYFKILKKCFLLATCTW